MEIEVGEYVRLDDGTIGKYNINKNWINVIETNDKYIGFDIENDVVNHSKNIIDLIEENDIIRYTIKGLEHSCYLGIVKGIIDARTLKKKLRIGNYSLEQVNILEILTKEQYNIRCYKLEE